MTGAVFVHINMPIVNQVETHVFWQKKYARIFMDKYNCAHMSWGPLAEGKNGFFTNEVISEIGAKTERAWHRPHCVFFSRKALSLSRKALTRSE